MLRDGSTKVVIAKIYNFCTREIKRINWTIKRVVLKVHNSYLSQVPETGRNVTGERVIRQVQDNKLRGDRRQRTSELAGEIVVLEIKVLERRE